MPEKRTVQTVPVGPKTKWDTGLCCRRGFAELHCVDSFSPLEPDIQSVGQPEHSHCDRASRGLLPAVCAFEKGSKSFHGNNFPSRSEEAP